MKILLLEDNPDHSTLIEDAIRDVFKSADIITCNRFYEGIKLIDQGEKFDLVLSDLGYPDSDTENSVDVLAKLEIDTPIIALTSFGDINQAKLLLKRGIQDYITKDQLSPTTIYKSFTYAKERKNFELRIKEEIKEWEFFCRCLAHDFNGPLRRILNYSELLQDKPKDSANHEEQKYISAIIRECERAQELIGDLSSYLKISAHSPKLEVVDLKGVIDETLNSCAELINEKKAEIHVAELSAIWGVRSKILIALQNLILNALKYNKHLPIISIAGEKKPQGSYVLSIKDNGIGMPAHLINKAFEPFQRLVAEAEYKGTGLGLSIVKRIMDQFDGKIWVESEVGAGSTFYLEFHVP